MANYRTTLFVEASHLVVMKNQTLAAFVIKKDHIVRLLIVYDDTGATFPKRLDDFSCLRSRDTMRTASQAVARSATPGFRRLTYVTRPILSVRDCGQQRYSYQ